MSPSRSVVNHYWMRLNRSGIPALHSHPRHMADAVSGMRALRPLGKPVIVRIEQLFDHAEGLPIERLKRDAATISVPVNNNSGNMNLLPSVTGHQAKFNLYARADRQDHDTCLDVQPLQADVSAPAQDHWMAFVCHLDIKSYRLA